MTVDILNKVYNGLYIEGNVMNQRTICLCLLAFAGFLRSSEVLNLKRNDIMFFDSYISIFIESNKTDKFREGAWVFIARTGTVMCPVLNFKKWAKIEDESELYLFAQLSATKKGYQLRKSNKPL